MKITDVRAYLVTPTPDRFWPWVFVEVETDEGVTGLGECTMPTGNSMMVAGLRAVKPLVVGGDPSHIEEIWQRLFRQYSSMNGRGYISALVSGIDIALWDIRGKVLGVPIYQLLGGPVRECVPLYTHIQDQWYPGVTPVDAAAAAKRAVSEGYSAIKTDPFKWQRPSIGPYRGAGKVERLPPRAIAEAVEWMDAVRDAVGTDVELMIDAHARFDVASAIAAARAVEHVNLTWFEEPVPPHNFQAIRQFRQSTGVPVCVGERHFTRYDYVPLFEARLVDYVMPDICWTGGISEMKRIAAMAEAYQVRISPHDALGPVSIMAGFHCCMTMPNLYRQECVHNWFPDMEKIITPMFDHHDGALWPSDRPGLGIELNHDVIGEYLRDPLEMDIRAIRGGWFRDEEDADRR